MPNKALILERKKFVYLKKSKNPKVNNKGNPKTNFSDFGFLIIFFHQKTGDIVHSDGNKHNREKLWFSPSIEKQA